MPHWISCDIPNTCIYDPSASNLYPLSSSSIYHIGTTIAESPCSQQYITVSCIFAEYKNRTHSPGKHVMTEKLADSLKRHCPMHAPPCSTPFISTRRNISMDSWQYTLLDAGSSGSSQPSMGSTSLFTHQSLSVLWKASHSTRLSASQRIWYLWTHLYDCF